MDTSSTRVSVTSSVPASASFWLGSMARPFSLGSPTRQRRDSPEYGIRCRKGKGFGRWQRPRRPPARVGRRRSTTQDHIADVALDLFATYGFGDVSVDDVALASGIARRTLFRYYPSKNAIPWGDFDSHLRHFASCSTRADPQAPIATALRAALLDFNTFDVSEAARHRQRMRVILQTAELQAYSMTMYAGWRDVVARFVARRTGARPGDLVPQTRRRG